MRQEGVCGACGPRKFGGELGPHTGVLRTIACTCWLLSCWFVCLLSFSVFFFVGGGGGGGGPAESPYTGLLRLRVGCCHPVEWSCGVPRQVGFLPVACSDAMRRNALHPNFATRVVRMMVTSVCFFVENNPLSVVGCGLGLRVRGLGFTGFRV